MVEVGGDGTSQEGGKTGEIDVEGSELENWRSSWVSYKANGGEASK